jgi:hypothetical protein
LLPNTNLLYFIKAKYPVETITEEEEEDTEREAVGSDGWEITDIMDGVKDIGGGGQKEEDERMR